MPAARHNSAGSTIDFNDVEQYLWTTREHAIEEFGMRGVELGRKRVRDLLTVLAKLNPADCLASEPAQITQSSGIPFDVGMKTTWKPSTKRSPELKPFGPYTVGHPEGRPRSSPIVGGLFHFKGSK